MSGKNREEITQIAKDFAAQYCVGAGSQISVGIGKDSGVFCLRVYCRTAKQKKTVPAEFQGVKVFASVIGVVRAQPAR